MREAATRLQIATKLQTLFALDSSISWGYQARRLGIISAVAVAALALTVAPAGAVFQMSQNTGDEVAETIGSLQFVSESPEGVDVPHFPEITKGGGIPAISEVIQDSGVPLAWASPYGFSLYCPNLPTEDAGHPALADGVADVLGGNLSEFAARAVQMETPVSVEQEAAADVRIDLDEPLPTIQTTIMQLPTTDSVGAYIWPSNGTLSSRFGSRSASVGSTNHKGIDITGRTGDPIYAADGGEVVFSDWSRSFGYMIQIRHDNGHITLYAHNSELLVSLGERVAQGQQIALMGATGIASGVHLHFELIINDKNVDPLEYL